MKRITMRPSSAAWQPHIFSIIKSLLESFTYLRLGAGTKERVQRKTVAQIRLQLESTIEDIKSRSVVHLQLKIRAAPDAKALWMLRSDIHQLLSRHFNQSEASHRINSLLPCFVGWIPERQLIRI